MSSVFCIINMTLQRKNGCTMTLLEPTLLRQTRKAVKLLRKGTTLNGALYDTSGRLGPKPGSVIVTAGQRCVTVVSYFGTGILERIKETFEAKGGVQVSEIDVLVSTQEGYEIEIVVST
jgi:hypothetical protein